MGNNLRVYRCFVSINLAETILFHPNPIAGYTIFKYPIADDTIQDLLSTESDG